MPKFTDSLRGYAHKILERDGFKCRYCGLDGSRNYDSWLALSWDHLLPRNHLERDNPEYIVAACHFCNTADNKYFQNALKRGITFEGLSQAQLIAQRKEYVEKTRATYHEFWLKNVSQPT